MLALVDCNSFYASCEQVFRPDLRGRPVVVLSNNDGCIIARSAQAKVLGVADLEPYFKQRALLQKNGVQVFSANFRLYGDLSAQVMQNLRDFSPAIEQYSIDEMFLDMQGIKKDLQVYGADIRRKLWRNVRMPVGVGIAPSKTLAKLANHAAKHIKRDGVAVLDAPHKWQWLQKRLPVGKIWGVGKRLQVRLNAIGIETIFDLAQADPKWVRRFTSVNMEKTIEELNGIACYELEEIPAPRKEIFVTRSFAQKTDSLDQLLSHVSRYAAAAAEKLRAQGSYCQTLYVFVHTSRFDNNYFANSISVNLPYPTSDSALLVRSARLAMQELHRPGHNFNKCGVGLLDVRDRQFYQSDLFHDEQAPVRDSLMGVLDSINRRYGRDTLVFGAEGLRGRWTMRQDRLSPSYTSQWHELPVVHCRDIVQNRCMLPNIAGGTGRQGQDR